MDYTIIEVPDMNDSVSRVVLSGTAYLIRFTYNDSKDYWKFSLYECFPRLDPDPRRGVRSNEQAGPDWEERLQEWKCPVHLLPG